MKAIVVSSFDQSPKYMEFSAPTPADDEVVIEVLASGLHPIVKAIAKGDHYSASNTFPFIPGIDGVGELDNGTRVYFASAGPPYGTMAERTVAKKHMCMPLPDELDTITAAAVFNPGLSSWLALSYRAQLVPNETVLINGATGVAGRLAIQIAKHLGAKKIIATGRNQQALNNLEKSEADVLIRLDQPANKIMDDIAKAINDTGINVVLDYLWGTPAEAIISAIAHIKTIPTRTRFVQVGDVAGKTITLSASALRSSQIELYGSGIGSTPIDQIIAAVPQFTEFVATKNLNIKTKQVNLENIAEVWNQTPPDGCRFVLVP